MGSSKIVKAEATKSLNTKPEKKRFPFRTIEERKFQPGLQWQF